MVLLLWVWQLENSRDSYACPSCRRRESRIYKIVKVTKHSSTTFSHIFHFFHFAKFLLSFLKYRRVCWLRCIISYPNFYKILINTCTSKPVSLAIHFKALTIPIKNNRRMGGLSLKAPNHTLYLRKYIFCRSLLGNVQKYQQKYQKAGIMQLPRNLVMTINTK